MLMAYGFVLLGLLHAVVLCWVGHYCSWVLLGLSCHLRVARALLLMSLVMHMLRDHLCCKYTASWSYIPV